jgi:signal transduction histidine kinase
VRVLLVEDEQPLARYTAVGLRKHGLAVDIALDGRTALDKCQVTPYDVVVLDRNLPVVHGDVVCRELAEQGTARVLMLTASGAHELRTPLTTMRTAIDVTLDGEPTTPELITMAGDVRTAVEHSQRTLDGLLTLASSQTGEVDPHPVDLADVLTDAIGHAEQTARTRDIEIRTDLRTAPISGEPTLLERLARNLLDNAIGYNHAGGHVTVETGIEADRTFLRIANTGPPVTETSRLLEPFVRDRTHTDGGTGLGLSIVHAVVIAHDGDISVVANPAPTGGLTVTAHFCETDPSKPSSRP